MHKKIALALPLLALTLSGCGNDNKELRNFAHSLKYDDANLNTKKAYLETDAILKNKQDEIIDTKKERIYFSKVDGEKYFYHRYLKQTGKFINNEITYLNEKISFEDNTYKLNKVSNDEVEAKEVSEAFTLDTITTFFYTSDLKTGKTGGYYYGDELKLVKNLQELYSVKDNKLIYDTVNFLSTDNEYLFKLRYEVNNLGMLYKRDEVSAYRSESLQIEMKTTIKYNKDAIYDPSNFID